MFDQEKNYSIVKLAEKAEALFGEKEKLEAWLNDKENESITTCQLTVTPYPVFTGMARAIDFDVAKSFNMDTIRSAMVGRIDEINCEIEIIRLKLEGETLNLSAE